MAPLTRLAIDQESEKDFGNKEKTLIAKMNNLGFQNNCVRRTIYDITPLKWFVTENKGENIVGIKK